MVLSPGVVYNTGLVLSGGVVRGFAHLGALKALEEKGLVPDALSGTSVGAIVGAFCADGFISDEILEIFARKKVTDVVRLALKKEGLMQTTGLQKLLKKNLKAKTFDKLKKPFTVAVTNLSTGKAEYIGSGNLIDAVLASSAIPVVFEPVKIGGYLYIDGGVTDNFPVGALAGRCKTLIGVNIMPIGPLDKIKGPGQLFFRAFHIGINASTPEKMQGLDIYIEPLELKKYGLVEIKKWKKMYDIGYTAAIQALQAKNNQINGELAR